MWPYWYGHPWGSKEVSKTFMKISFAPSPSSTNSTCKQLESRTSRPKAVQTSARVFRDEEYQGLLIFSGRNITTLYIALRSHSYNIFTVVFCVHFPDHSKGREQNSEVGVWRRIWVVENSWFHIRRVGGWGRPQWLFPMKYNDSFKFWICILEGVLTPCNVRLWVMFCTLGGRKRKT